MGKQSRLTLMKTLDKLNTAFHLGTISVQEKNWLAKAMITGSLSEVEENMMRQKIRDHPDNLILLEIMNYFQKGEQPC